MRFNNFIDNTAIRSWGYFGYSLLFSIPVVGAIVCILCAIFARNLNVKNFALAFCIMYSALLIVSAVLVALVFILGIDVRALLGIH